MVFMIADFQLSEHLSFYEMTDSQSHSDLVELNRDVALERPAIRWNMEDWAKGIFEPVRAHLGGKPLFLTSGYRCAKINNATPGASIYSQHLRGQAADILMDFNQQERVLAWVLPDEQLRAELKRALNIVRLVDVLPLPIHQLRFYPSRGFVHFGLATGWKDGQISWGCK